jgi:hypothetical protein
LVPQKSREFAATAPLRRRMRRIADARPVTDVVVDRFIMVVFACAFWRAVIAVRAIGCAAGVSFRGRITVGTTMFEVSARRDGSVR